MGYLLDISQEMVVSDIPQARTLLAIGSLIGSLEKRKQKYKGKFIKVFNKFASLENKQLYIDMFSMDKG
jgi:predicted ribosome-associated RNA-binding protein Tma20